MKSHCLKCRKDTENINPKVSSTSNGKAKQLLNIVENPKYDGYQRGLASMVYKCFDKKSAGSGVDMYANNERPVDWRITQINY